VVDQRRRIGKNGGGGGEAQGVADPKKLNQAKQPPKMWATFVVFK
jgi:hypothetical protein